MKFIKLLLVTALFTGGAGSAFAAPFHLYAPTKFNVENTYIPESNLHYVQSSDGAFRISQLEEQVRTLNGRIEDMSFQILQMQEQIRKMQEDNEFRFQELEDKQGSVDVENNNVAQSGDTNLGKQEASESNSFEQSSDANRQSITDLLNKEQAGEAPISLGTLTFDADGNVVDSNIGDPIDLTGQTNSTPQGLPDTPNELFDLGYQYVQGGDYDNAIDVFKNFSMNYVGHPKYPEAQFWLGESYFSLGNYDASAKVFLDNHRQHPHAKLAAQNLLKLGVSLAGLNQRELACATYAEVPKKYPNISKSIRNRIDVEQRNAKCQS